MKSYKSRTWGNRPEAAPPRISWVLLERPGVHVLETAERRVRERAHRTVELGGVPRGQRGELVQRHPGGVGANGLTDLVDLVEPLGLVSELVGRVHQIRRLLVAPADGDLTGELVRVRRDVLAGVDRRGGRVRGRALDVQ